MGAKSDKKQKLPKILTKKFWGILNVFDIAIIGIIFIAILAFFFIVNNGFLSEAGQAIKNKKDVQFDVLLVNEKLSKKDEIFVPGEKTFITIRNVPYTELEVVNSLKIQLPESEEAYPYAFNYLVTVKDKAAITSDGPVVGGNKVKIGLPVILEGFDYKLQGVVTDVRIEENAS